MKKVTIEMSETQARIILDDEEFLRRVKLDRLMAEEKELLDKNDSLIKQMEAAADKPIEFMKLWKYHGRRQGFMA